HPRGRGNLIHFPHTRGKHQVHVGARVTVRNRKHIQCVHPLLIFPEETGAAAYHPMKASRINLVCQTVSPSILIHQTHTLNKDVDPVHRQSDHLVQGVLHLGLHVVRHLGDLGAVTDNDVEIDHQLSVLGAHFNSLVQIFPSEQLGNSVLQLASGSHSHQSVTIHRRGTRNGADHLFRHVNAAEGGGHFNRHRDSSLEWEHGKTIRQHGIIGKNMTTPIILKVTHPCKGGESVLRYDGVVAHIGREVESDGAPLLHYRKTGAHRQQGEPLQPEIEAQMGRERAKDSHPS